MTKWSVDRLRKRWAGSWSVAAAAVVANTKDTKHTKERLRAGRRRLCLFLELGQRSERLERREAIDIDRRQLLPERIGGRRLKKSELPLRLGWRSTDRRAAAARQLVALERRQDLARPIDHRRGHAC